MNFFKRLFFKVFYLFTPPWDTNLTPPELLQFIQQHPPGRALDLGCGTGTNVLALARHGWQATGVDFVPKAIRKARRKAVQAGVQVNFLVDDVTRLTELSPPFDLILDIGCFHSLNPTGQQAYRHNVARLLAPGGSYLLYTFTQSGEADSDRGVAEADLALFDSHMELISRSDGTDRGSRASAWLHYQKPGP